MTEVTPELVPVFPLPNVVLFPHTTLPLHIFEPRYRRMMEDVLKGERRMVVSLLHAAPPEGAHREPPFHDVAGLGRINRYTRLPDGRFNLVLEGTERVRLEEIPSEGPYRRARMVPMPEDEAWLKGRSATAAVRRMLELARSLGMTDDGEEVPVPPETSERAAWINRLASGVLADPEERQRFLESEGYHDRVEMVVAQLRLAGHIVESIRRAPRPRDPGRN